MTRAGRNHQGLASGNVQFFTLQDEYHLTLEYLQQSFVRSLMLTQTLSFVECEHSDAACIIMQQLTADDTSLSNCNERLGFEYLSFLECHMNII